MLRRLFVWAGLQEPHHFGCCMIATLCNSYYNNLMFLTMHIIEDALKEFCPESRLSNGSAPLRSIKINECAEDCVTVSEVGSKVLITHGRDRIEVPDCSLDRAMNTILDVSRACEVWERDLFHMLFSGCSLQDIVEKAYPLFQNPVFFVDETDRVLARTEHEKGTVNEAWDCLLETGYMPYEAATTSRSLIEGNYHAHFRRGKNTPFLFSPPTRDIDNRGINYRIYDPVTHEAVGTLIIIENETPVTLGMLNLSQVLAEAVDEWMNVHRNDHPFKNARNLVQELIEQPDTVQNKQVLRRYLPPCDNGYELAVVTGCGHIPAAHIETMIKDTLEGSLVYKYGEEVVAVIPRSESEEEIRRHLDRVLYYQGVRIGISYPFEDTNVLDKYYHQAKVALSYGNEKFAGLKPETVMRYFTDGTVNSLFGADIAHPALKKLQDYDRKHGGELYETLYEFLRNERSLIESAKALHIHRNSLVYRVEKIRQITELDLDDADVREYLLVSFRILKEKE